MESLVIDTYSRRLQDMARSAARVARSAARVSRFCVLAVAGSTLRHVTMICTNKILWTPAYVYT